MAKGKKTAFFCQNCGHEESKWLGQCPMCKEWSTFVEERVTVSKSSAIKERKSLEVLPLSKVKTESEEMQQSFFDMNEVSSQDDNQSQESGQFDIF